jgi:hypothetical protein
MEQEKANKRGSYLWLKKLPKKQFKRLIGVPYKVYKLMVKVFKEEEQGKIAGRKSRPLAKSGFACKVQRLRLLNSIIPQEV